MDHNNCQKKKNKSCFYFLRVLFIVRLAFIADAKIWKAFITWNELRLSWQAVHSKITSLAYELYTSYQDGRNHGDSAKKKKPIAP